MSYGFGRINDLAHQIHTNAKAKGFHEYKPKFGVRGKDTRHILSWIALIHSEASEALEAARVGDLKNFGEELADIVIRVLDCAEATGVNIEQEIVNKIEKNAARPVHHGGKLA